MPLVNLIVSLAFSGITSRVQNTVRSYTVLCLISGVLTAAFIVLCFFNASTTHFFILLVILGSLLSAVSAVRVIFDYKLPCEVMELHHYSLYVSVNGIITGIVGLTMGVLLTVGYGYFSFPTVSAAAFLISGLSLFAGGILNDHMVILHITNYSS